MLGAERRQRDVGLDRANAERGEDRALEMPQIVGEDLRPDLRRCSRNVTVLSSRSSSLPPVPRTR